MNAAVVQQARQELTAVLILPVVGVVFVLPRFGGLVSRILGLRSTVIDFGGLGIGNFLALFFLPLRILGAGANTVTPSFWVKK